MRGKTAISLAVFLSPVLLALLLVHTAEGSDAMLGFNQKAQEHSEWCWAGSSQSVLEYYGAILDQCTIANFASGKTTCCTPSGFSDHDGDLNYCNCPNNMWGSSAWGVSNGSSQGVLAHWGVNSNVVYSYLSQTTVVNEINAGRPFLMRFGWYGGGGHALDGFGYDNDGQYLHYMDPWPGHGYTLSLYSWVVSAYHDHDWTHTLQITTNLPACIYAFAYPWTGSGYRAGTSSIQAAYNESYSGDTIYARALGTIENVNFNRNISVGLYGGVSCDYSAFVGLTRISGSLTVSSGSVQIGYILIEP
jgi:hypothetical protein